MGKDNANWVSYYQTERQRFNKILESVNEFERLDLVEQEIDEKNREFSNQYPEDNKAYQEGKLFDLEHHGETYKEQKNMASFIVFLEEVKKIIIKIISLKFNSIDWLRSFPEFCSLYRSLKKFGIISSTIGEFILFFKNEHKCTFNTNIHNTCVLLYNLINLNCISETTLEIMISNKRVTSLNDKKSYTPK